MKHFLPLIFTFLLIACGSDDDPVNIQTEADILQYIEDNNLNAQKSNSGLYYVIDNEGTGARPTSNSDVKVAYTGKFLNGSVFDQNSQGITFNLQQVIRGWTEGITYFKEGGSGKLLIPPHLGYGNNDYNGIPGGSVLIFDISLLEVFE